MSDCLDELERMMLADGELTEQVRPRFKDHVASCEICSTRVEALRSESSVLTELLQRPQPDAAVSWGTAAWVLGAVAAAVAAVQIFAALTLPGFGSVADFAALGGTTLFWRCVFFTTENGELLMTTLFTLCVISLLVLTVVGAWKAGAPRFGRWGTFAAFAGIVLAPLATHAAERSTMVAPGEVVDSTLFVGGRTVRIEGTVDGDIVASAQTVVLTGESTGNFNAMAQSVEIEGKVDGAVYCFCRSLTVRGTVTGNVYFFGEAATIATSGRVARDVLTFGEGLRVDGEVGRDVRSKGARLEIVGSIGRRIRGDVGWLMVGPGAAVGEDIDVSVHSEESAEIDPGAKIGGEVRIDVDPEVETPRYATGGFYLWKLAGIAGALLVGLLLFRLAPGMFDSSRRETQVALRSAGTGLIVLVATPIVAVLACVTVVALPLGIIALGSYALAVYLSSVLFAAHLGIVLLRRQHSAGIALPLLLGLVALTVAGEVPILGLVAKLAAIVFGLGLIYRELSPKLKARTVAVQASG